MSDNPLKKKSQGVGDTVEKVAYIATLGGILNKPKTVNGKKKDCGCSKRKKALNDKLNYNKED